MSGAGIFFLEATAVQENGRITAHCLGLYNEENKTALAHVISGIREYSNMPLGIQLSHAGRKASMQRPWDGGNLVPENSGGWRRKSSSCVPRIPNEPPADELTVEELKDIERAFADAATRARDCGINAIELHMAHGYLLHQFLSPISNHRSDEFGGEFERRIRFPMSVFRAVHRAVGHDIPVGVRLSATDWVDGGWNIEDTKRFSKQLEAEGCAFLDISSGGVSREQKIEPPPAPGYQVPFAAAVRECVDIPVIAVGLITQASHAEGVLKAGQADVIALARGFMENPRWPWEAAAELSASIDVPPQLRKSRPQSAAQIFNRP